MYYGVHSFEEVGFAEALGTIDKNFVPKKAYTPAAFEARTDRPDCLESKEQVVDVSLKLVVSLLSVLSLGGILKSFQKFRFDSLGQEPDYLRFTHSKGTNGKDS